MNICLDFLILYYSPRLQASTGLLSRLTCVIASRTDSVEIGEDAASASGASAPSAKTQDEIQLEKSWRKLDEEIRDVHHLINEFSNIVVPVGGCNVQFQIVAASFAI